MLGEIFWDVVPYVTLAIVVVGTWWRYRYDKFGWTTRSSQLYESRLLRIGSPMFHFGILVVVFGHVIGLLIPQSWTDAVGLSHEAYHVQAVVLGTIAGISTLVGITLLIFRRRTTGPVFMATTVNDKVMYVVLVLALVAGLYATALGSGVVGEAYNYRESVSVWFRSIWVLQPRGDLMAEAPLYYQLHVLIGLVLFALWPFTRLVHAFSAPIGYLFRPYIVYRSREVRQATNWWGRIRGAGVGDSRSQRTAKASSSLASMPLRRRCIDLAILPAWTFARSATGPRYISSRVAFHSVSQRAKWLAHNGCRSSSCRCTSRALPW